MGITDSLFKIINGMQEKKSIDEDIIIPNKDEVDDEDIYELLMSDKDENVIANNVIEENKNNAKAKVRNKPNPVFDDKSSKVTDKKDHFPINSINQARNAWARVNQYSSSPKWYKGSLKQLKAAVKKAVKKAYPSIELKD